MQRKNHSYSENSNDCPKVIFTYSCAVILYDVMSLTDISLNHFFECIIFFWYWYTAETFKHIPFSIETSFLSRLKLQEVQEQKHVFKNILFFLLIVFFFFKNQLQANKVKIKYRTKICWWNLYKYPQNQTEPWCVKKWLQ